MNGDRSAVNRYRQALEAHSKCGCKVGTSSILIREEEKRKNKNYNFSGCSLTLYMNLKEPQRYVINYIVKLVDSHSFWSHYSTPSSS